MASGNSGKSGKNMGHGKKKESPGMRGHPEGLGCTRRGEPSSWHV